MAVRVAAPCPIAATTVAARDIICQMLPSPEFSFVSNAPMSVCGQMLATNTGKVPSSICGMLTLRMPQLTLVGQSGPPTRIATFPGFRPLFLMIISIALVGTLSTPIIFCIWTDLPAAYPIPYWPTQANNFAHSPSIHATQTPRAKPMEPSRCDCFPMTMPANMYTAEPGTGGNKNMQIPMTKTKPTTMPKSTVSSSVFSQENKMKVSLEPMLRMNANSPSKFTLKSTRHKFQVPISSISVLPRLVYFPLGSEMPLFRRMYWRKVSRPMNKTMKTLPIQIPTALIQSFFTTFLTHIMTLFLFARLANCFWSTSRYIQPMRHRVAAAKNAINTEPRRTLAPETYTAQYMPVKVNVMKIMKLCTTRCMYAASSADFIMDSKKLTMHNTPLQTTTIKGTVHAKNQTVAALPQAVSISPVTSSS
mmetsp:Transcript_5214/g.12562  ORF Transcript_5214/g.12562 Transcript_5214/m.12562 type:complete len:420 (+) Transcript_5214:498-1757(+)